MPVQWRDHRAGPLHTPAEPTPVRVLHATDGRWYDGTLRCWRTLDDSWTGFATYVVDIGMAHEDWFTPDELQRR